MQSPSDHDPTASLRAALAGRYDVERELGAGGMGRVYLGRDVTLDRPVAIKVIAQELAGTHAARERFLREARTVAKLRHPNIVAVHAAGEARVAGPERGEEGPGILYFVMELVDGESLRDRLQRDGTYADAHAAPFLRDVARALGYAHAQGVVHRDVKPENILIDRATGRPMLTDFGIARAFSGAADAGASTATAATGTGFIVGSPRYMSPEQAAGERDLDGRSDLYSLGLVGYEMFTGAAPFEGTTPMAVLVRQLTERPAPLAERAPGAPQHVAAAIDRALEKDPAARWPDGETFARALDGDVAATGPTATPTAVTGPLAIGDAVVAATPPPPRRRWVVAALAAALLLAVGVGGGRSAAGAPAARTRARATSSRRSRS